MTMDDYCKYFITMSICRVMNTSFFSLQKTWWENIMNSEWSKPNRDGGCINNRETFLNNPQVEPLSAPHAPSWFTTELS